MQHVVEHKTEIMQNDSDAKIVEMRLAPPSAAGSYCYLMAVVRWQLGTGFGPFLTAGN